MDLPGASLLFSYQNDSLLKIWAFVFDRAIAFRRDAARGSSTVCTGDVVYSRAAGKAALLPQLFPVPEAGGDTNWQPVAKLMRKHTHLAAMVSFMSEHVAQHFRADRPRFAPAISTKFLNASARATQRFS